MTPSSVWKYCASEAPQAARLTESLRVDVAVIGAGYAGITAALALATGGASVAVIEAGALGGGGSGLNGGQLIPGLKSSPSELIAMLGPERGAAVVRFVMGTADHVFELIRRHRIDCDAQRHGWIQAAVSPAVLPQMRSRATESSQWGGEGVVLDAREVKALIGSRTGVYCGGWLNRRAGTLHPLNYLYGLVRAAQAAGARIFAQSMATAITGDARRWQVGLAHGPTLTASEVLICTNAYADNLWPGLRQSMLAANSLQIATAPLAPQVLATLLPQRQAVSDGRRVMNYFRIGPLGRFMIGGRGPFGAARQRHYDDLLRDALNIFPQLRGVPIEQRWVGKVALTRDFLPHVHQPRPGLWLTLGCNGRGIGLMSALGTALGEQLLGRAATQPFEVSPVRPLPLHRLHRLYAGALIQGFRLLDRLG